MSVWIICDGDPDCDNLGHPRLTHNLLEPVLLPDGWTGTLTNAHCPQHPDIPF